MPFVFPHPARIGYDGPMFILYIQDHCVFSKKVLEAGEQMGVEFTVRNIKEKKIEAELLKEGGKRETPYFIDTDTGTKMYGSDDIVSYLINTLV